VLNSTAAQHSTAQHSTSQQHLGFYDAGASWCPRAPRCRMPLFWIRNLSASLYLAPPRTSTSGFAC
jgi:hypothetical protein